MTSPLRSDAGRHSGRESVRRIWSRNLWTLILFIPCALVAVVSVGMSAWWGLVRDHSIWDDYAIMGAVWLAAAIGASMLFRFSCAAISPERFLPRWLALLLLAAIVFGALWILLWYWMASAWGP